MITLLEMAEDNVICKSYGSNYLVSICPAFDIDRVRFSVVKIGSNGKDCNDIYLTTEEARIFFNEIDNNTAVRRFEADKQSKYPSAFTWKKGENACKKLSIGGGEKGIRINSSIIKNGKTDYKNSVVPYADLQTASFLFKLFSGLIPVIPNSYYGKIYDAFWNNANKYGKKNAQGYDSKADDTYKEPDATPEVTSQSAEQTAAYNTYSKGTPYKKGTYTIVPTTIEGEDMKLIFTDEISSTLKWFEPFLNKVRSEAGATLKVLAKRDTGNNLIFMGLPA